MEGDTLRHIDDSKRTLLEQFGRSFLQSMYHTRTQTEGERQGVIQRHEAILAKELLVPLFETYLKKLVHENHSDGTIADFVGQIEQLISRGIILGTNDVYMEFTHSNLSEKFIPILGKVLGGVTLQVRSSVQQILGVLATKGGDAAIAYLRRSYQEEQMRAREIEQNLRVSESARENLAGHLKRSTGRFRDERVRIQGVLATTENNLRNITSEHQRISDELVQTTKRLAQAREDAEKYKKWWQKEVPKGTAYAAIQKLIAPLALGGKTLVEQVQSLITQTQTSPKKGTGLPGENLRLGQEKQRLENHIADLETSLGKLQIQHTETIQEREEYILTGLQSALAWYLGALLEECRPEEYLQERARHLENMFFQYRARHEDALVYCRQYIATLGREWSHDSRKMEQYLRKDACIPEHFLSLHLKRASEELGQIVAKLVGQEKKDTHGATKMYMSILNMGNPEDIIDVV